ncbi:MAG: M20/M25/M40 family metallo-hydrolase, partial [Clostridia bacterium]|nr:M20/M25/M40 family metallo-hydrolase [Clostridia bacterium]
MDEKKIFGLIDEHKEELFKLLSDMIKINSESFGSTGNEQEMAEFLHKMCIGLGLESEMYSPLEIENFENHPDYMPGRNLERRYNVSAVWKGEKDENHLMLMGHSDTVETGDVNNWDKAPFSGEISDGKIFGRGACDDKYALAVILFLIKLFKDAGYVPKKNIVFSAYSDEEHGGSHGALAAVLKYPCPHIVNLDGREDQIWHCASGGQNVSYIFHTKNTVDSAKTIAYALPVVLEEIEKFAEKRKAELSGNRFYKDTIIPETSLRYMDVHAGNHGNDLGRGDVEFTYYTDKTKEEICEEFKQLEKVLSEKLEPMGIIGDGIKAHTRFFHYAYCDPESDDINILSSLKFERIARTNMISVFSLIAENIKLDKNV